VDAYLALQERKWEEGRRSAKPLPACEGFLMRNLTADESHERLSLNLEILRRRTIQGLSGRCKNDHFLHVPAIIENLSQLPAWISPVRCWPATFRISEFRTPVEFINNRPT